MRLANLMSKTREEDQIHALYTQALQIMNSIGGSSTFMRKSHMLLLPHVTFSQIRTGKQIRELTETYQSYVTGELIA